MIKWEYCMFSASTYEAKLFSYASSSIIWTKRDKDGKTSFETLQDLGEKGWELVSTTPITVVSQHYDYTQELCFVLKRPMQQS